MEVTKLFCRIAIICCFLLKTVSATVVEESQTYHCLKNGNTLSTESIAANCDQRWTKEDVLIGNYRGKPMGCISPCQEVFSGRITLSECANVTLVIFCANGENGALQERRISYRALEERLRNEHQHLTPGTTMTVPTDSNIHSGLHGVWVLLLILCCWIIVSWCRQRRITAQVPHTV